METAHREYDSWWYVLIMAVISVYVFVRWFFAVDIVPSVSTIQWDLKSESTEGSARPLKKKISCQTQSEIFEKGHRQILINITFLESAHHQLSNGICRFFWAFHDLPMNRDPLATEPLHLTGGTNDFWPQSFYTTPIGLMLKYRIQPGHGAQCSPVPPPIPLPAFVSEAVPLKITLHNRLGQWGRSDVTVTSHWVSLLVIATSRPSAGRESGAAVTSR